MSNTNRKKLQGEATVRKLLRVARSVFLKKGFTAATTEEIIRKTGLTKGALYHHFPSKVALFEAVYIDVEKEMADRIQAASGRKKDPFEQLKAGCFAYLDCCADNRLHRILRSDGPAALGQQRWAEIDREFGVYRLLPFLQTLQDEQVIKVSSVEAFAYQLTGAMNEATFWVSGHDKPAKALRDSKVTLGHLLDGVRLPMR